MSDVEPTIPNHIEIKETTKETDYIQMISNLSLSVSILLIFIMKIFKFILSKKKYNLKQNEWLSRSNSV